MKTILVDAVHCYVVESEDGNFVIDQEMHELLESYPNPKIIATNAYKKEGFEKYKLTKIPYEVFTLEHAVPKTDPEYYSTLLQKHNLQAGECIYFEHNIDAVKSAQSVGIKSYHYDEKERDLISLKKFLDQNL